MIDALKDFLLGKGYTNVYADFLPDPSNQRDVIALAKWQHTFGEINDGTGLHFIQIQVRRRTAEEAQRVCRELFLLLDSGIDETPLPLTPETFCIARPRRGPVLMERTNQYTKYYCEIALWGEN